MNSKPVSVTVISEKDGIVSYRFNAIAPSHAVMKMRNEEFQAKFPDAVQLHCDFSRVRRGLVSFKSKTPSIEVIELGDTCGPLISKARFYGN